MRKHLVKVCQICFKSWFSRDVSLADGFTKSVLTHARTKFWLYVIIEESRSMITTKSCSKQLSWSYPGLYVLFLNLTFYRSYESKMRIYQHGIECYVACSMILASATREYMCFVSWFIDKDIGIVVAGLIVTRPKLVDICKIRKQIKLIIQNAL